MLHLLSVLAASYHVTAEHSAQLNPPGSKSYDLTQTQPLLHDPLMSRLLHTVLRKLKSEQDAAGRLTGKGMKCCLHVTLRGDLGPGQNMDLGFAVNGLPV